MQQLRFCQLGLGVPFGIVSLLSSVVVVAFLYGIFYLCYLCSMALITPLQNLPSTLCTSLAFLCVLWEEQTQVPQLPSLHPNLTEGRGWLKNFLNTLVLSLGLSILGFAVAPLALTFLLQHALGSVYSPYTQI